MIFKDVSQNCINKLLILHPIQMVWIETPTNPLLKLVNIKGAADIVHQHEVHLSIDKPFLAFKCMYLVG